MSATPCFPFNPIVDYSNPSNLSLASSPDLPDSCNLYSPLDISPPLAQFSNDHRSSLGFSAGPTWPASDPTANSPSLASATHETLLASPQHPVQIAMTYGHFCLLYSHGTRPSEFRPRFL